MSSVESKPVQNLEWKGGELYLLDQTQLPINIVMEKQESVEQVWESIKKLKVRGAPAIGVAGAYGLVIAMRNKTFLEREKFIAELEKQAEYLNSSRPTAVNLNWALNCVVQEVKQNDSLIGEKLLSVIEQKAIAIHLEDIQMCKSIGEHGLPLIREGSGILTHCNAGRLATTEYGTATAPMYLANDLSLSFRVYADESRPLLQGSRLTAWELQQAGIDVTIITDNTAAYIMQQGLIDLVIVGTDRVAANGDVANKIGTLGVAILAKYFEIPFYVACPASTVDLSTPTGKEIVIEERGDYEVTHFGLRRTAPEGIKVRNPAFDITPHELVTGLITDRGIVQAPYNTNLKKLFG